MPLRFGEKGHDPAKKGPRFVERSAPWAAFCGAALLGLAVFAFVELEPRVEGDFFFSSEDPQLRTEERIAELFGDAPQLFCSVRTDETFRRSHLEKLDAFTTALGQVDGVAEVRSITQGPLDPGEALDRPPAKVRKAIERSPFWSRLLLGEEQGTSFVVLRLGESADPRSLVPAIDGVAARFEAPDFQVGISGVPCVAEQIRRGLSADLRTFSVAALIAFTILIALLFRSLAVVAGMMATALAASFATFLVRDLAGMSTGILTPNLWTISFVLTLSHVVYLTASYRQTAAEIGPARALRQALRLTGPPSLWSLATNLLGFSSLLLAPAKPLRELGISGGIAAIAAFLFAFGMYPAFLRLVPAPRGSPGRIAGAIDRFFAVPHPWIAVAVTAIALALAPFALRVNTDPSLPSYFARGGEVREGLEEIDRSGGTSPLELIVRDAGGGRLADEESFDRLMELQRALESDPAVGAVISIAPLMAETDRPWLSFLVGWEGRVDRLDSAKHGRVGRAFLTEDRKLGRFVLRMRELSREQPREEIVARLTEKVHRHGFEVEIAGGLFKLQGDLSGLVRGSVLRGLGGLLALFFLISLVTSRSLRTALAMAFCLLLVPFALFGVVGLAGTPLDIIAAPAANVALPMGIDEMIHLSYALRRARGGSRAERQHWRQALQSLWRPIAVSLLVVTSGFALFMLSRFPPTQRLGLLVCVGTAVTDAVVLLVLPALASRKQRSPHLVENLPLAATPSAARFGGR